MKYRVLIEQDERRDFRCRGSFTSRMHSQGQTREEATENIGKQSPLYLESLEARDEPIPPPITERTR